MFIINYNFQPSDSVFVVIDGTRIESGKILNVNFKVYENESNVIITVVEYSILLDDSGEGTVTQDSTTVFETLLEASNYVSNYLTPTATVTPTVTPTAS